MDYLGWIVALLVLFFFGKRNGGPFTASFTAGVGGSTFGQQDTNNSPANQPSTFSGGVGSLQCGCNSLTSTQVINNTPSPVASAPVRTPVTFGVNTNTGPTLGGNIGGFGG